MNLELVMHNLKIVGMLGEQDKLVTGPTFGLRTPTTYRALVRRWNGENRETDLLNLRNLLCSAICIAQLNEGHPRTVGSERLIEAICAALRGMQTLTRTYFDDQETCARIELLIQECRDQILTLRPSALVSTWTSGPASPAAHGTPPSTPHI